jgi:hypothetical protein
MSSAWLMWKLPKDAGNVMSGRAVIEPG